MPLVAPNGVGKPEAWGWFVTTCRLDSPKLVHDGDNEYSNEHHLTLEL